MATAENTSAREEEIDSFYEFHTVRDFEAKTSMSSEILDEEEEDDFIQFRRMATRAPHMRRRSISWSAEEQEAAARVVRRRLEAARESAEAFSSVEDLAENAPAPLVRMRACVRRSNSPAAGWRRPSSVLVHDDDLVKLAEQLSEDNGSSGGLPPPATRKRSRSRKRDVEMKPSVVTPAGSGLVRRNSSGYSSGSCGSRGKHSLVATENRIAATLPLVNPPAAAAQSPAVRRNSVISGGSANAKAAPRRSSVCVTGPASIAALPAVAVAGLVTTSGRPQQSHARQSLDHSSGNQRSGRLNFGSFFGSGASKKNSAGAQSTALQAKIARKYDRQSSNSGQSGAETQSSEDKKAQFLQTRSYTGLNLFGSRRRSIAITDDAYKAAVRSAKSHLDLSQLGHDCQPSPTSSKRVAGPGLSELEENKASTPECASPSSSTRAKIANLKERSWTELEKLWRGKAKELPNIEYMLKPRSSFRAAKDRSARAKTIPLTGVDGPADAPKVKPRHLAPSPRSTSPAASRLALPTNDGGGSSSPMAARKAIDLLAPHVLSGWQREHGHAPIYQRYQSVPAGDWRSEGRLLPPPSDRAASVRGPEPDHFAQLVKSW